jgi:glycogen(starch) synthase
MRILMLGWEFPPYITGGLGVACHGLTRALDGMGHEVVFLVPGAGGTVDKPTASRLVTVVASGARGGSAAGPPEPPAEDAPGFAPLFTRTALHEVPAAFTSPYGDFVASVAGQERARREVIRIAAERESHLDAVTIEPGIEPAAAPTAPAAPDARYTGDLIQAANDYARRVVALARHERFDIIHAHDWLTFPAGIAVARVTDRPLVAHVHSTEFDRSGERVNQTIYDLERRGMYAADRVIAVSALTKSICVRHYGANPAKVDVVYNGVEQRDIQPRPGARIEPGDPIVLFLGRVTSQKGPEYFLQAARRVLEIMPSVKFVVAGSGDLAAAMIRRAGELAIRDSVLFTGFLRGEDVERVFRIADCFVMPSVSEPFGIAALEAVQHGVPIIISRQSGVAEVLTHALKVDFWKTDEMADKILAVLRRPALGRTMREHGTLELSWLTWEGAAEECLRVYGRAIRDHANPA